MAPILFLLRRYLVPREGNLLSFALWTSIFGVVIGIVQLMLVLSVMSGFLNFLKEKYTNVSSEVVVLPKHGMKANPQFQKKILGIGPVEVVSPFSLGQSMLIKEGVAGVTLEGVDLATASDVTDWKSLWIEGPDATIQTQNPHWIWLGNQLATKLHAKVGDIVQLMVANEQNRVAPFVVTAITRFGLYDHDLHYARIDLKVLNEVFRRTGLEPMYKCKLKPGVVLASAVSDLKKGLSKVAQVKPWNEINQNLFLAVEDQKQRLFLVLEIIVALAGVNVVSLLIMSAHYRRRDMAILRAMGLRARGVFLFFVAQGLIVGGLGIGAGIVLGIVVCKLVERYQPALLSESIYNVTKLPFRIEAKDVALISLAALALCLVFSIIPALRAAKARPVEALRYE